MARRVREFEATELLQALDRRCAAGLGSRSRQHRLRSQLEVLLEAAVASGTCSPGEAARILREIGGDFLSQASRATSRRKRF